MAEILRPRLGMTWCQPSTKEHNHCTPSACPPHDVDAEEAVIGSILIDGESLTNVTSFLRPTDFYGEKNRWCYQACFALFERGEAINQVTVAHELSLQDRLEPIGGTAYLSHLVLIVPTSVHIEYYARIVQRTSVMRQIIRAGGDIASIGYEGGRTPTRPCPKPRT